MSELKAHLAAEALAGDKNGLDVRRMTREELLNGNADIVKAKVSAAAKASPNAVLVIFSNPMDAMCQVAMKASGFPRERVVGQGGALDSARYRYFVADAVGVSVRDVHGYVIGGHTDTTMVERVYGKMTAASAGALIASSYRKAG